mgnify:CR=1 FL=1
MKLKSIQFKFLITIISAIQGLYTPITNSIYPHMIKEKKGAIYNV